MLTSTVENINNQEIKGFQPSFSFRNRLIKEKTKKMNKSSSLPNVLNENEAKKENFLPFVKERGHLNKLIDSDVYLS